MTERITKRCPMCGTLAYLDVDSEALDKYEAGALLQDAFPDANPFDREFLKSGYCGFCQAELFGISIKDAVLSKSKLVTM